MQEWPLPRPALPFALAFIAGVALESVGARSLAAVGLAFLLAGSCVRMRRAALRIALLVGCAACGAWLCGEARSAALARTSWLPQDGRPLERQLRGTLLDVPEPLPTGEVRILLAALPEPEQGSLPARVQLTVLPAAADATALVLGLRPGDEVRAFCRLRLPRHLPHAEELDPRRALLAHGIDATGSVKSARLVVQTRVGATTLGRLLGASKAAARARLDRTLGRATRARAVLGAMLLGDRAGLAPDDARTLRDSGLVHLLSISGLHVSLAIALLLALLGRTRLGPFGVWAAIALALAGLCLLTGAEPPVIRSALSAALLLLGRALGRSGDALNTLALVAAALVAAFPPVIWNPSFQLTFAASAGLLAFAKPLASLLPFPRPLGLSLALSTSAYLVSTPILLVHFGRAAPASILTNLGASVFCALTLASGGAALLLADVPGAGELAGWLAGHSVDAMFHFASLFARLPGAAFRVGSPAALMLLAYYLLLSLAARPGSVRSTRRIRSLSIAILLGFMHLGPLPAAGSSSCLLAALDVGQGQAVVLRGPSGGSMLLDAGGTAGGRFDAGERVVAPFLARRGCRRLEVLLVTHGHDDHAGGAAAILREFEVGELWLPVGSLREPLLRALADQAREHGTALVLVGRGFKALRAGLEIEILHPTRSDLDLSENDRSAVLQVRMLGRSLLVPGDLEAAGERELLARGGAQPAEVLVVGHHGGASSSGALWLETLSPTLGIISAGLGNRFGHPDPGTLLRLARSGVRVYRTDRDGSIVLYPRARGWQVETALTGSGSGSE